MIELNRKIGHKSVMSIRKFFIARDELAHLLDQVNNDMEVIGYASAEGYSDMDQVFAEALSVDGASTLWVSVYMHLIHG